MNLWEIGWWAVIAGTILSEWSEFIWMQRWRDFRRSSWPTL